MAEAQKYMPDAPDEDDEIDTTPSFDPRLEQEAERIAEAQCRVLVAKLLGRRIVQAASPARSARSPGRCQPPTLDSAFSPVPMVPVAPVTRIMSSTLPPRCLPDIGRIGSP